MSRRIRTTRQARRIRSLALLRLVIARSNFGWTGMPFTQPEPFRFVVSTISADRITAEHITPGRVGPLYRLASCPLGDPVIDWEADT